MAGFLEFLQAGDVTLPFGRECVHAFSSKWGNISSADEFDRLRAAGKTDFSFVKFEDLVLAGKNLSHLNFRSAVFNNVNLKGANFTGTNLWGVNLRQVDLTGANLWNADLTGANLTGADLGNWKLEWRPGTLIKTNLRGAKLTGVIMNLPTFSTTGLTENEFKKRGGVLID